MNDENIYTKTAKGCFFYYSVGSNAAFRCQCLLFKTRRDNLWIHCSLNLKSRQKCNYLNTGQSSNWLPLRHNEFHMGALGTKCSAPLTLTHPHTDEHTLTHTRRWVLLSTDNFQNKKKYIYIVNIVEKTKN